MPRLNETADALLARPALSARERTRRLNRIKKLAWLLDAAVRLPGTRFRFGLGAVVGLTPAAGDAAMTAISLYIVYEAYRLGLPTKTIVRMLGNVGIEALAGSVPVVGDVFDAGFKANLRNIMLIDAHEAATRQEKN
ncbi:DUF4112 domain-containing protein [Acetobacteraceae bacterium KSS8]|uniref:DUF4112 domain-containing protein n=1 Tax=Endosaccharibacter trunci TaxID=2812733 RepID=A0ABT1W1V4_9PROT|nr:DUF4112 domain-containing protein [Acetobacteraceae bacterium KSS8]